MEFSFNKKWGGGGNVCERDEINNKSIENFKNIINWRRLRDCNKRQVSKILSRRVECNKRSRVIAVVKRTIVAAML